MKLLAIPSGAMLWIMNNFEARQKSVHFKLSQNKIPPNGDIAN